jgi:hypothetical protein
VIKKKNFPKKKIVVPLLHDLNEKREDYLKKPAPAADNPTPPSPQPPPPTNPVSVLVLVATV